MLKLTNRFNAKTILTTLALGAIVSLGACSEEEEACVGAPMIMEFSASTTTVAAGGAIDLTVLVDNFNLSEGHAHNAGGEGGAGGEVNEEPGVLFAVASCPTGHAHIYLDDLMTNPILMQHSETASATIPVGTAAGTHTLIARLHTADHLIVEPQVTKMLTIEVQ